MAPQVSQWPGAGPLGRSRLKLSFSAEYRYGQFFRYMMGKNDRYLFPAGRADRMYVISDLPSGLLLSCYEAEGTQVLRVWGTALVPDAPKVTAGTLQGYLSRDPGAPFNRGPYHPKDIPKAAKTDFSSTDPLVMYCLLIPQGSFFHEFVTNGGGDQSEPDPQSGFELRRKGVLRVGPLEQAWLVARGRKAEPSAGQRRYPRKLKPQRSPSPGRQP